MNFTRYLKSVAGEALLVVLAAWAVACVGMHGFFLDSVVETFGAAGTLVLVGALVAFLVSALYVLFYKRSRVIFGVAGYLLIAAVLVVASLFLSTGEYAYLDAEGNYFYFALEVFFAATLCFMLTRSLAGSMVWFVGAAFVCALVQAFYQSEEVLMSLVAVFSSLALVVHKNFKLGLESAQLAQRPSYARNLGASLLAVGAAGVVACAIWFLVLASMGLPVLDIKLVTDYRHLPYVEFKGVAQENPQYNFELTSENLVDGFAYTTDDLLEDPDSSIEVEATSQLEQQLQQNQTGDMDGESSAMSGGQRDTVDEESLDPEYDTVSYSIFIPWVILWIILALLVVGTIVGYFVGRRRWRIVRLARILNLEPRVQVIALYNFLFMRLARIGFKIPAGMTLAEYANATLESMDILNHQAHVAFDDLTATYEKCAYGNYDPTEDEVMPFVVYYLYFWKAAFKHLGPWRYFFKSFFL